MQASRSFAGFGWDLLDAFSVGGNLPALAPPCVRFGADPRKERGELHAALEFSGNEVMNVNLLVGAEG
jgi:hypothetical protein